MPVQILLIFISCTILHSNFVIYNAWINFGYKTLNLWKKKLCQTSRKIFDPPPHEFFFLPCLINIIPVFLIVLCRLRLNLIKIRFLISYDNSIPLNLILYRFKQQYFFFINLSKLINKLFYVQHFFNIHFVKM